MRYYIILTLLILVHSNSVNAQNDKRLRERIDSMLSFTQQTDIEGILSFTYPKLFTIAPKEDVAAEIKAAFETEAFSSSLDSLLLIKIFPVFSMNGGQYAKLSHSMIIRMKFNETLNDEEVQALMESMEKGLEKASLRFDKKTNTLSIFMIAMVAAVKDQYAPDWTFVNFKSEDPLMAQLFEPAVIEKLKTVY